MRGLRGLVLGVAAGLAAAATATAAAAEPPFQQHDLTIKDFHFRSGETLPELKLHYWTLGAPKKDAAGHVVNAVMILHGTGGSGHQFAAPQFADVLFKPGGVLDPAKYFLIMPDDIGHGGSSKPSNGLHMKFPHYDYTDMVEGEHAIAASLGVRQLRLVMGTSMGCMHSFMYVEMYPDGARAAMPLACQAMALAGRNRLWREMSITSIEADPAWMGGEYKSEPELGLRGAENMLILAGASPWPMQLQLPTRQQVDAWYAQQLPQRLKNAEANDLIYQLESSRNYDPEPELGKIKVPVTWVNSADDFINPPEMPMAQADVKKIKLGKFVLIPAGPDTHGHGTHTWAKFWQKDLADLLKRSGG
ncbi:MAG TPA: alpha/beta fold hydrolase [Phenylobacterium sp.]|jgi:homoserine O-acetyltransferase|uniref:alpha/beta fold hydrolase n=1 Tax=Phenylobacterium sp. TaxID=1871053 RepID=UPI002D435B08|nr:alpha/beta fold hydrolase [Phenylobacterium sp.]HZZ67754.1 alpha/beta fold hydrolase [Phenylobacterium sp.]